MCTGRNRSRRCCSCRPWRLHIPPPHWRHRRHRRRHRCPLRFPFRRSHRSKCHSLWHRHRGTRRHPRWGPHCSCNLLDRCIHLLRRHRTRRHCPGHCRQWFPCRLRLRNTSRSRWGRGIPCCRCPWWGHCRSCRPWGPYNRSPRRHRRRRHRPHRCPLRFPYHRSRRSNSHNR